MVELHALSHEIFAYIYIYIYPLSFVWLPIIHWATRISNPCRMGNIYFHLESSDFFCCTISCVTVGCQPTITRGSVIFFNQEMLENFKEN